MNIGEAIGQVLDQVKVIPAVKHGIQVGRIIGIIADPHAADKNPDAAAVSAVVDRTMTCIAGPWYRAERELSLRSFLGACRIRTVTANAWDMNWAAKASHGSLPIVRHPGSIVGDPRPQYAIRQLKQVPESEAEALELERAKAMHAHYVDTMATGINRMEDFPRFWAVYRASDALPKWEPTDAKANMLAERAAWAKVSMMIRPVGMLNRSNQHLLEGILVDKPMSGDKPGFQMGWLDEAMIYGDDAAELGYRRLLTRRHDGNNVDHL